MGTTEFIAALLLAITSLSLGLSGDSKGNPGPCGYTECEPQPVSP